MEASLRTTVLMLLLYVPAVAFGQSLESLEIAEWSGSPELERRGRPFSYALVENLAVEPFDVIRTGADSSVVLRGLHGAGELLIGSDTVVAVRTVKPVPELSLLYGRIDVAASSATEVESGRRLTIEAGMYRIPIADAPAYGSVYRAADGVSFTTLATEVTDDGDPIWPRIDLGRHTAIGEFRPAFVRFDELYSALRGERDYLDELMRRDERSIGFPDPHSDIDELTRMAEEAALLGLEIERMHRGLSGRPDAAVEYRWVFARWGVFLRRAAAVRYMARVLDQAGLKGNSEPDS